MCLLLSMLLVLNLSCKINQKKTLCLSWHELLQSHLNVTWTAQWPLSCLYTFEEEKKFDPQIKPQVSLSSESCKTSRLCCRIKYWLYASSESGRWKRSWKFPKLLASATEIALFFAKENSSGYASWGMQSCPQISCQSRQVFPSFRSVFAIASRRPSTKKSPCY